MLLWSSDAAALQPLSVFLRGAQQSNVDYGLAQANRLQKETSLQRAWGAVIPKIEMRGSYTRNQEKITFDLAGLNIPGVVIPPSTVQPIEQWDGHIAASVSLIDLRKFADVAINRRLVRSARFDEEAAFLSVQSAVTQTYYQLVANMALVEASQSALAVARSGLDLTQERFHAGSAASLDVDRARAEVERQVQQLASSELGLTIAAQTLSSMTDVVPDLVKAEALNDDLHQESGLDTFECKYAKHPRILSATQTTDVSGLGVRASWLVLVPALDAQFTEKFTNSTIFTGGHEALWAGVLTLRWDIDAVKFADIKAAEAQLMLAQQQERKARLGVADDIHRAWHTVVANIARSRSARVQAEVSKEAAALAQDRYRVGSSTQLDLLQAQRDAFGAEVTRIQADADLLNSRLQLQVIAGRRIQVATMENQE